MESGQLVLSTQVLQELFVTLTRKAAVPHDRALTILDDLSAWPLFSTDFGAVREATLLSASARISFLDALVVTAAARMGAERLLSEDMNHRQMIAGVRIVNPFEPS